MLKKCLRQGLCPGPLWGSSRRSPRPRSRLGRGVSPPTPYPLGPFGASILALRRSPVGASICAPTQKNLLAPLPTVFLTNRTLLGILGKESFEVQKLFHTSKWTSRFIFIPKSLLLTLTGTSLHTRELFCTNSWSFILQARSMPSCGVCLSVCHVRGFCRKISSIFFNLRVATTF